MTHARSVAKCLLERLSDLALRLVDPAVIKIIAEGITLRSEVRKYAQKTLETYTKNEIAEIMGAVYQGVDTFGVEGPLSVPILIVCGEEDNTGKVKSYSTQWAENESRELVWIPDAAHNANQDQPEIFNRIVDEFLGGLRS